MEHFVTKRAGDIKVPARWEPLQYHSKALLDIHGTLIFFLREGTIPQRYFN